MAQAATAATRKDWKVFNWFERHREVGAIFIRLWVGWHLVYGTQDNVRNWERMLEFRDFLTQFGFPFPLVSAHVSVYAQFICGLLYILGLFTRQAAVIMIGNFIIALTMVHLGDPYPRAALAFAMLSASLFLLFNGPGAFALDNRLRRK